MAINIAKSGFDLTVTDLREQPLKELARHGARVVGNPREVAESADIVLASLPSNVVSEQVALGTDGVLAGAKSGDIYIELSTISPEVVHTIARQAAEKGVTVLDAPVSGGLDQRQEGTLSIMVGGDAKTVAKAMPVFKAFGDKVFHAGESGAGATVKLINNLLAGINMVATMEALVLGVKAGLSVQTLKEVISASSGNSKIFEPLVDKISTLSPEPRHGQTANQGLHTIGKDVRLANDMAQNLSVPLSLGSTALQPFLAGLANNWANKEHWVIMEFFEQMSGVRVRPLELTSLEGGKT
jgi:3-hydroxyisobutyrate dehydrogenase